MPRKPLRTADEIYDILKDFNFMKDGKYCPYDDPVWRAAADVLPGMSRDYVWLYVTKNRNGISNMIHGLTLEVKKKKPKSINKSNFSMQAPKENLPEMRKEIHLSTEEWKKLGLHSKTYNDDREYEILEVGWTDKIYYTIWDRLKIPCPFAFQSPKINRAPGATFLTIRGFCAECHNSIHMYSHSEPTDRGIVIYVSTFNTQNVMHKKKRQLRGKNREAVANALKSKTTYMWRRDEANEKMQFGDKEPAHLYTEATLRKAKQQQIDRDLDLHNDANTIQMLMMLKQDPTYSGIIREIGADKTYVMYWSEEQLYLYKWFAKNNPICSISIDATGSLVKRLPTLDNSRRVILLYQAMATIKGKSLPLFQFVSEKHDTNTIRYWVGEWLRSGAKSPLQVVTDYSLALLNATSLAFNHMPLNQYVDECFRAITADPLLIDKIITILRIDIAHLIKFVSMWACLKRKKYQQKDFYVRCVGLLARATTIEEFKTLMVCILTIAYAKSDENTPENACFQMKKKLFRIMETGTGIITTFPEDHLFADMPVIDELNSPVEQPSSKKRKTSIQRPVQAFLDEIKESCMFDDAGSIPNEYFNPDFAEQLLKLSRNFVLWSAIVPTLFYRDKLDNLGDIITASSAASEEYFKDLKHLVFREEKNNKIEKFLKIHINSLNGTVKLLAARENLKHEEELDKTTASKTETTLENYSVADFPTSTVATGNSHGDSATRSESNSIDELIDDLEKSDGKSDMTASQFCTTVYGEKFDEETYKIDSANIESANISQEIPKFCSTLNSSSFDNLDNPWNIQLDNEIGQNSIHPVPRSSARILKQRTEENIGSNSSIPEVNCHLNYVDEWGGHMKNEKKPSYYLDPKENLENYHKRPKCSGKLQLITNGCSMGIEDTSKGAVRVINTCPVDSTLHAIRSAYVDWQKYSAYVENSKSNLMEIVKMTCSESIPRDVYRKRAEIILSFKKIEAAVLNCYGNVSNIINEILCDEPSITFTSTCPAVKSTKQETRRIIAIPVSLKPLYEHGLSHLQEALRRYVEFNSFRCRTCRVKEVPIVQYGEHLFFDIEALQWDLAAFKAGMTKNSHKKFSLRQIPTELTVGDLRYSLVAAIEHILFKDDTGHYRPYVRRINGRWQLHDGINKSSKIKPLNNKEEQINRTIHVLFYIKKDTPTE